MHRCCRQRLEDLLIAETQALVEAEGGQCEARPRIEPGDAIVSTIGFAGLEMHGALTLLAPEPTARALAGRVFGMEADGDSLLCDMVGELSNMLLGRYRSGLLRAGVEIFSATPVTVLATEIDLRGNAERPSSWHGFTTTEGRFWLCLDVSLRDGFTLPSVTAEPIEPNELELLLF